MPSPEPTNATHEDLTSEALIALVQLLARQAARELAASPEHESRPVQPVAPASVSGA